LFFTLPENLFAQDGTVNQNALTGALKASCNTIETAIGAHFETRETAHFIIFSEAADKITERYAGTCEFMYSNLQRLFNLKPDDRVWDGKCVLILFDSAEKFEAFAKRYDGLAADFDFKTHPAYHAVTYGAGNGPRIAHMCFGPKGSDPAALVHEGGHAMLMICMKPAVPPRWLNEGIAVFMEVACQPKERKPMLSRAISAASWTSLTTLIDKTEIGEFTGDDYCVAYSLIDYLQLYHRGKLMEFIRAFKGGKTADQALQEVYGFNLGELERRWKAWAASPEARKRLDQ